MALGLAPHIHAATFGDRAVILDERADRYLLLGAPAGTVTDDLDAHAADGRAAGVAKLVTRGFVIETDRPRATKALPPCTRSLGEAAGKDRARLNVASVAMPLVTAIARLRVGGIGLGLRAARRARNRPLRARDDDCSALATAWRRARQRIPIRRVCLPEALAFQAFACTRGLDVSFVIGVRLDPFSAHSWVQSGTLLLIDELDVVAGFKPILVI